MRWIARAAVAALVLVALAIGVLVTALPRLAKSGAARARIDAAARSLLGRELRYAELDFGLLPPSLLVIEPSLSGESAAAPPLARAGRVALRAQLLPLVRGRLEVSSLVVEGLAVHLVRTADGWVLPRPDSDEPAGSSPPDTEPASPEDEAGIALGIRTVSLRDASLALEDRSASAPVTWRVEDLDVTARGGDPGAPIALDGSIGRAGGGALAVEGPVAFEAELESATGASGPFTIDASAAGVRYGADFTKPAGTRALLRGTLTTGADGALGADDLVLELHNLVLNGAVRTGDATALSISAAPFALDGWQQLVPPLAIANLSGRVAIPKLELSGDPSAARGLFVLDGIEAHPSGLAPIALSGELVLDGATLRTRDAVLRAAEQAFSIDARVHELFTTQHFEVAFEAEAADSNALLAGFAHQPDRLYGPLDVKGVLRGQLSGERSILDAVSGDLAFDIEGGRIVGASLLEVVLGSLGEQVAEAGRNHKDWERFTSEQFESLGGTLRIADGRLVTAPVTLRYRDYGAQLEGPIGLADLALDLTGTLTFEETLDAALARSFGAHDDYVPERRSVSLAAVRGTLGAPEVQLAGSSVLNLAAGYAKQIERDDLKRRVEKEFGTGSGEIVDQGLDVLEGLLGGGRKK